MKEKDQHKFMVIKEALAFLFTQFKQRLNLS